MYTFNVTYHSSQSSDFWEESFLYMESFFFFPHKNLQSFLSVATKSLCVRLRVLFIFVFIFFPVSLTLIKYSLNNVQLSSEKMFRRTWRIIKMRQGSKRDYWQQQYSLMPFYWWGNQNLEKVKSFITRRRKERERKKEGEKEVGREGENEKTKEGCLCLW